jgi:AcrR family transcriptional regulator
MNPLYAQFLDFKPKKGDLKKIQILEAAIDCLTTLGIEKTTFESIGLKLGIGKAHVAYHFPEKEALIKACIQFTVATVQQITVKAVQTGDTPEQKLKNYIQALFDWIEKFPKQAKVFLLLYYYSATNKNYREMHNEIRILGLSRISAILKELKKQDLAPLVQSILTGYAVDYLTTFPKNSLKKLKKQVETEILNIVQ